MSLSRLAWLLTVLAGLVTAVLLLISGYKGFAGVSLAVTLAAAVNLI